MRDAELYQLVREFFLNTIELLKTKIENGARSFDRVELARVTPTRRLRRRWVTKLQWLEYWDEIEKSPPMGNLTNHISGSEILSGRMLVDAAGNRLSQSEYTPWLFHFYMQKLMERYVYEAELYGGPRNYYLKDGIFDKIYEEFEQYVYTDRMDMTYSVPLLGFSSDLDVIQIENNLCIRKLSNEEREGFWYQAPNDIATPLLRQEVLKLNYVIESFETELEPSGINANKHHLLMRKLVLVLSLLKDSPAVFEHVWHKRYPSLANPTVSGLSGTSTILLKHMRGYSLNSSEVKELQQLWKQCRLPNFEKDPRINLALERLYSINYRSTSEDKLIDCWVALEALFKKENETKGIGGHVGKRLSSIPGMSGVNRHVAKNIRKTMDYSYQCRDAIVHGKYEWGSGAVKAKDGNLCSLKDYLKKTVNYLRKSLKLILLGTIDLDNL